LYEGEFQGTNFASPEILIDDFDYEVHPSFNQFDGQGEMLESIKLVQLTDDILSSGMIFNTT